MTSTVFCHEVGGNRKGNVATGARRCPLQHLVERGCVSLLDEASPEVLLE